MMNQRTDARDLPVTSDVDYEVKLLAERAGIPPEEARDRIRSAGSLAEALEQLGLAADAEPQSGRTTA